MLGIRGTIGILSVLGMVCAVLLEARYGRARLEAGERILRPTYAMRLLFLCGTLFFLLIVIEVLRGDPVNVISLLLAIGFATTAAGFCVDSFTRYVAYGEEGVRSVALLPLKRRRVLRWNEIQRVSADIEQLELTSDSSKVVVSKGLRGWRDLFRYVVEHHPEIEMTE